MLTNRNWLLNIESVSFASGVSSLSLDKEMLFLDKAARAFEIRPFRSFLA